MNFSAHQCVFLLPSQLYRALLQREIAATFFDILKNFFVPRQSIGVLEEKSVSVCQKILPLFHAVVKFCSTNRLFNYIEVQLLDCIENIHFLLRE